MIEMIAAAAIGQPEGTTARDLLSGTNTNTSDAMHTDKGLHVMYGSTCVYICMYGMANMGLLVCSSNNIANRNHGRQIQDAVAPTPGGPRGIRLLGPRWRFKVDQQR